MRNSRVAEPRHRAATMSTSGLGPATVTGRRAAVDLALGRTTIIERYEAGRRHGPDWRTEAVMGFRVIVTTGLATLYLAGCLAALSLLLSMWSPSL